MVGVDGFDGVGKTTFADLLARTLAARTEGPRLRVVRVSVDDHLLPNTQRYRRGRSSPTGYFEDSHDLTAIRTRVVRMRIDNRNGGSRLMASIVLVRDDRTRKKRETQTRPGRISDVVSFRGRGSDMVEFGLGTPHAGGGSEMRVRAFRTC